MLLYMEIYQAVKADGFPIHILSKQAHREAFRDCCYTMQLEQQRSSLGLPDIQSNIISESERILRSSNCELQ